MKNRIFLGLMLSFLVFSCFSQEFAKNTPVHNPFSLFLDNYGNLYFVEPASYCQVKKIDKEGKIYSLIQKKPFEFSLLIFPEYISKVSLGNPYAVSVDNSGNIYVIDLPQWNGRIIKIDKEGYARMILSQPYEIKGKRLNSPATTFARDSSGNIYFADNIFSSQDKKWLSKIYKIDENENINLVAEVPIQIISLALDNLDNIYIGTIGEIYKIRSDKKLVKIAGTGELGFDGDNGPSISAKIRYPQAIDFDKEGNLYFADRFNYRIRKIDTNGIITTIAGTGRIGFTLGKSLAISSPIGNPTSIAIDKNTGIIYFADVEFTDEKFGASRIMKIENGQLETVAGGWEAVLASNPDGSYLKTYALYQMWNFYFQNKQFKEYEECLRKYLSSYKRKDEYRLYTWKCLLQFLSQDKEREKDLEISIDEFINEWKDKPDFCVKILWELFTSLWREPLKGKELLKKGIENFIDEEFTQVLIRTYLLTPNMADKEEIIPLCKKFLEKYPKSNFFREIEMKLIDELIANKEYKTAEILLKNHEKFPIDIHLTLIKLARCAKNDGRIQDAVNYLKRIESLPGFKGTDFEKIILPEMIEIYKNAGIDEEKIKILEARKEILKDKEAKLKEVIDISQKREKENDFVGAIEELEKFINQFPNNESTITIILPKLIEYLNKLEDKKITEKKLLSFIENQYLPILEKKVLLNLCNFYIKEKNWEKALEIVFKLMDKFTDEEVYKVAYSVHSLLLSDVDKKEAYEKSWEILKKFIGDTTCIYNTKDLCINNHIFFVRNLKSVEEKIMWLRKCIEILPTNYKVRPYNELIRTLSQNAKEENDYKDIVEEYEKYSQILEKLGKTLDLVEIYYAIGKIYEEKMLRKNIEAAKWYEKAIKLWPTHPKAILAEEALNQIR